MKLSVITINYNNAAGLRKTFESVRRQQRGDYEYIVVDGGSSDGSVDVIRENEDLISRWISERDGGIYNAMNKGVMLASGEYCLFLNSGDNFHDEFSLSKILNHPFRAEIVLTNVNNYDENGKVYPYTAPSDITFRRIWQIGIHHAGSFIKTDLMRNYPYREDLKILADRDFFIKTIIFKNVEYEIFPEVICDFEYGGASSDRERIYEERQIILHSYFPPRFAEEYNNGNLQILEMAEKLSKCKFKIIKFICKLDLGLIKVFKMLLGKKVYHDKWL